MVGDMTWAIAGLGLVILGVVIGWTAFRRRRQA
jgi:LPXTG-motif cell wall-anchored protein